MRTVALAVIAVVLAGMVGVTIWVRSGPSPAQFAYIANPRLTRLPDRQMLVVEAHGDPNVVGAHAFKTLFKAYYKLDGVSRGRPPGNEDTDIRRLVDFVVSQGYRVIGDHEEEYVRGPGMCVAGDPDQYLTIIRLRVQTVDVVPAP